MRNPEGIAPFPIVPIPFNGIPAIETRQVANLSFPGWDLRVQVPGHDRTCNRPEEHDCCPP
jgi:hypothetical protein